MAITTIDQALAGMKPPQFYNPQITTTTVAGRPYSFWFNNHSVGGYTTYTTSPGYLSNAGGVTLSSTGGIIAGQIPHYDPGSGSAYVAKFQVYASAQALFVLADRLWHCGANTTGTLNSITTAVQTINSVTWPARDNNGTSNGAGVMLAIEIVANMGAGSGWANITYVNANGTTGLSSGNATAFSASSTVGSMFYFRNGAGDTGFQNVTSLQLSSSLTSGNFGLVAFRPLATCDTPGAVNQVDLLTGGFTKIQNGTVPFLIAIPGTTTLPAIYSVYTETQG